MKKSAKVTQPAAVETANSSSRTPPGATTGAPTQSSQYRRLIQNFRRDWEVSLDEVE